LRAAGGLKIPEEIFLVGDDHLAPASRLALRNIDELVRQGLGIVPAFAEDPITG